MDPALARPEYIEALTACIYRELAERVLRRDAEKAGRDHGHRRAVLKNLDIPWHRRSAAVQKEWLDSVQAAMTELIGQGTKFKGIPQSRVEGMPPTPDDSL